MKITEKVVGGALTPPTLSQTQFSIAEDFKVFSERVRSYSIELITKSIKRQGFDLKMLGKLFQGKMTRSKLVFTIGRSLQISDQRLLDVATSIEILHEASLVHDDIQDKQKYRRGIPTVWYDYSINEAISWGDFLLSLSFEPLLSSEFFNKNDIRAHNLTIQKMLEGQNFEQKSSERLISRDDYFSIASLKTGALIELPIRLLLSPLSSENDYILTSCRCLGIAYQSENDLNDFLEGNDGIDYVNKVSSLPFLELYHHRLKTNSSYTYDRIFKDKISVAEGKFVSNIVHKIVDENLQSFYQVFSKLLNQECFNLLQKSLNKYFVRQTEL